MAKVNKYIYYWVIGCDHGYCGWEPESWYDKKETKYSQVLKDLSEYRRVNPRYSIKERRELNEEYVNKA